MHQFAESLESDRAFFFDSGSNALYALLKSIGVAQGDDVILQVFTCPSVPSRVVRLGATPVYVDIDPHTFNLDPDKIEAKITDKTKVIIAQHTFGIPAEMDSILEIAHKYHLWVIEDACHALGSKYKGQEVSTFGDAAIYSFGWYKPITLGMGGAAIVNNSILKSRMEKTCCHFVPPPVTDLFRMYLQYSAYALLYTPSRFWFMKEIYRRLRDFASGPRKGDIEALIFGQSAYFSTASNSEIEKWYQEATIAAQSAHLSWGQHGQTVSTSVLQSDTPVESRPSRNDQMPGTTQYNKVEGKRMNALEQRRLFIKLAHWDDVTRHQKWIVSQYRGLLCQAGYAPFEPGSCLEPVYYKYPLLCDPARKREVFEKAKARRIEMSDMFGSPLYPVERAARWKALGYHKGMCPISESISDRIVALPVHAKVHAKQIEETIMLLTSP